MSAHERTRDEKSDAVVQAPGLLSFPFKQEGLTLDLCFIIFSLLPVYERALACSVCHAWHDYLNDAAKQRPFWLQLDFSTVPVAKRTQGLCAAYCARAGGELTSLNVSGWSLDADTLLSAIGENKSALRSLSILSTNDSSVSKLGELDTLDFLFGHFPRLLELDADVYFEETSRRRLDLAVPRLMRALKREFPFGALRLRQLYLVAQTGEMVKGKWVPDPYDFDIAAMNTALRAMPTFRQLVLSFDIGVDELKTLLSGLHLEFFDPFFNFTLEHLPSVTAQLPWLKKLCIQGDCYDPFFDGEEAKEFAAALKKSKMVELKLCGTCIWDAFSAGTAIIASCTGLPSLKILDLSYCSGGNTGRPAFGAKWLASLLEHPDCALEKLDLTRTSYGLAGARLIFDAAMVNTSLRDLRIDTISGDEFAEQVANVHSARPNLRITNEVVN